MGIAILLLLSIVSLLLTGLGLSYRLLRLGLEAAQTSTEQRLLAIGTTLAEALAQGASERMLPEVARDNQLEAAYLLDEKLSPSGPGRLISLLRVDPDKALHALRGQPQVGMAYRIDSAEESPEPTHNAPLVLAGYFAVRRPMGKQILVLEAARGDMTDPHAVIDASFDDLRACGLSRQKQGYARSLAELVKSGALDLHNLPSDDEEAIARLTQVKGIGLKQVDRMTEKR